MVQIVEYEVVCDSTRSCTYYCCCAFRGPTNTQHIVRARHHHQLNALTRNWRTRPTLLESKLLRDGVKQDAVPLGLTTLDFMVISTVAR